MSSSHRHLTLIPGEPLASPGAAEGSRPAGDIPEEELLQVGDLARAVGKTVRAKAVTAGGESGNPSSPHFNDQAKRYSTGDLRDVYFYPSQLKGHTERVYHPGN